MTCRVAILAAAALSGGSKAFPRHGRLVYRVTLQHTSELKQSLPRILQLPPLILHPFSGGADTGELVEGSRAALALEGLTESSDDELLLQRKMLAGRYQEVRMLLFLGKDLFRWMQQCAEHVGGDPENRNPDSRIVEQSFAAMVVESPPESVKLKLESWGVTDRKGVFSRAIGIHSLFQAAATGQFAVADFPEKLPSLRRLRVHLLSALITFSGAGSSTFHFELYASEEYARLLCDNWDLDSSLTLTSPPPAFTPIPLPAKTAPIPPAASD